VIGDEALVPVAELYDIELSKTLSLMVDIVFAIDESASMGDETAAVSNNLMNMLSTFNSGRLDPRIHLMGSNNIRVPAGIDPAKMVRIDAQVGSENALGHVSRLLSGFYNDRYRDLQFQPLAQPLAFRSDANLEVIIISDDDGEGRIDDNHSNLAADFDPNNEWKATINAVVGLPTSQDGQNNCDISGIGSEYIDIVNRTNGTLFDICTADWSQMIAKLTEDIIQRHVGFQLKEIPNQVDQIIVQLDGADLMPDEWLYDQESNKVILVKYDKIKNNSVVTIKYQSKSMAQNVLAL
jgi:hypothetical protein